MALNSTTSAATGSDTVSVTSRIGGVDLFAAATSVCLLAGCCCITYGDAVTQIKGTVTAPNGDPIAKAIVTLEIESSSYDPVEMTTDAMGDFDVMETHAPSFDPGFAVLSITAEGFEPYEKRVPASGTMNLGTIKLERVE